MFSKMSFIFLLGWLSVGAADHIGQPRRCLFERLGHQFQVDACMAYARVCRIAGTEPLNEAGIAAEINSQVDRFVKTGWLLQNAENETIILVRQLAVNERTERYS